MRDPASLSKQLGVDRILENSNLLEYITQEELKEQDEDTMQLLIESANTYQDIYGSKPIPALSQLATCT